MAGGLSDIRHYQLTLDASTQRLSEAVPADQTDDAHHGDPLCAWIDIQADDGNSNPIFIGGDEVVSSAVHGVRIPKPVTSIPDPPYRLDGPVKLSDVWAIGTSAEKLDILVRVA